jgi:uncharacterized protein (TIGR02646 family)
MLPIEKLPEPQGLLDYKREMSDPSYDGFTAFRQERDDAGNRRIPRDETPFYKLREQLLREQKFVCSYCGQKVLLVENEYGKAQMKTEHFLPQDGTSENDLNYQNLLGCCLGNDNKKGKNHCDSMKSDGVLVQITNPATRQNRDEDIIYKVNNASEEVQLDTSNDNKRKELIGDTKGCLNLNHDYLRKERFSIYKNVIKRRLGEDLTRWGFYEVQRLISDYDDSSDGHHKPFKDFVLWYLMDWLSKNSL